MICFGLSFNLFSRYHLTVAFLFFQSR